MNENRVLVWDLPVRLFHWLLAISFAGAFLTAESERWRDVHLILGYTMLGLLVFRLAWGFAGPPTARFASFSYGFGRVKAYLASLRSRSPEHTLGHNPAGAWAIFGMLALGFGITLVGAAIDLAAAPEWLTEVHEMLAWGMLTLVGVHVAGVLVSSVLHRENLVRSMITGMKRGPGQGIRGARPLVGAMLLAAVVAFWVAAPGWFAGRAEPPAGAVTSHEHHG